MDLHPVVKRYGGLEGGGRGEGGKMEWDARAHLISLFPTIEMYHILSSALRDLVSARGQYYR